MVKHLDKGILCLLAGVGAALAAWGGQVAAVDTDFLKDLIRIPSVSDDVAEVNRAADFTRRYAESRGLRCQIETNAAGRCMVWVANVDGKRPDVLLSAHLDVVPAQTPDLFVPKEADGCIYGRGASDCKEHVALSMHLMERLAGRVSVGAIFGTDEEIGGTTTAEMMKRGYGAKRLVIVLDSEQFALTTRQKGLAAYTISFTAPAVHSGLVKGVPPNAALKLMDGYRALAACFPPCEDGSWCDLVSCDRISGDRERAELTVKVRSARKGDWPRILALIREKTGGEVSCTRCGDPVELDEKDPVLLDFLARMRRKWPDRNCRFYHLNSSTDARHLQYLNLPMLIIGVDARGAHSPSEHVKTASLGEYADLLAAYLEDGL
ncbi:MAG: M20/M25/M40 family metallo-hydrolase [Kiritimatiellae bacterium]|nr:M20/M25/M40 family metallo-hydrolase [Kiritimatiellia bacterium]